MNQSLLDPPRVLTLPTYVANSISCQTRFLYLPRRIRISTACASPSLKTSIHLHDSIVSFAAQTQCLFRMRKTQVSRTSLWMEQTKASCFAASSDEAFMNHVFLYFFTTAKGNLTQTFNGSASDSLFFLHYFAFFCHRTLGYTHTYSHFPITGALSMHATNAPLPLSSASSSSLLPTFFSFLLPSIRTRD